MVPRMCRARRHRCSPAASKKESASRSQPSVAATPYSKATRNYGSKHVEPEWRMAKVVLGLRDGGIYASGASSQTAAP